ncbi:MAG: nucleoside hydrolase [Clostridia bacterium]|nr:nucleoside hydrolase [Clostridia bacterium]
MDKIKVVLDTDIGTDIDDSECLAYLLCQERCDLLGVTTVSGEAVERAMLASVIMRAAGKKVPIHPGADKPLCSTNFQPRAGQKEKLTSWEHDTDFEPYSAIEFLKETIEANPGEVILLAIGPLTNIALLCTIYPETVKKLKELVIMGGQFFQPDKFAEWNIRCDPYAAKIVFQSGVKMRLIGLDVTRKVTMKTSEFAEKFTSDVLKPVKEFSEVWFRNHDISTFHDPLAATVIFEDLCTYKRGTVTVDLTGKEEVEGRKGATYFEEGDGCHFAADTVNPEAFFKHYFKITLK